MGNFLVSLTLPWNYVHVPLKWDLQRRLRRECLENSREKETNSTWTMLHTLWQKPLELLGDFEKQRSVTDSIDGTTVESEMTQKDAM